MIIIDSSINKKGRVNKLWKHYPAGGQSDYSAIIER